MARRIADQYPSLQNELLDEGVAGLATLEIACLARYTQAQIDAGEQDELKRCFETVRVLYLQGDTEVRSAVRVSYLEALSFFDGRRRRSWAKPLLPAPLSLYVPA